MCHPAFANPACGAQLRTRSLSSGFPEPLALLSPAWQEGRENISLLWCNAWSWTNAQLGAKTRELNQIWLIRVSRQAESFLCSSQHSNREYILPSFNREGRTDILWGWLLCLHHHCGTWFRSRAGRVWAREGSQGCWWFSDAGHGIKYRKYKSCCRQELRSTFRVAEATVRLLLSDLQETDLKGFLAKHLMDHNHIMKASSMGRAETVDEGWARHSHYIKATGDFKPARNSWYRSTQHCYSCHCFALGNRRKPLPFI